MGRRPEWWTPMPCLRRGRMRWSCGRRLSSSLRQSTAWPKIVPISFFSSSVVRSKFVSLVARFSHSRLEKAKMMQGSNFLSTMS